MDLRDLSRSGNVGSETSPFERLRLVDPILLVTSLALTAFGILAVYIAGSNDGETYALNQLLGFVVGLAGAVPLAIVDYRWLRRYLSLIYGFSILTLLVVDIAGASAKGAQRWIDVGPVQIQPAEFAKLIVVLMLAAYFTDN
ncbi:MAG TPA: FtsW/RodA/SpoVE family cell cycle protein, partial [Rubrobacteraceae bacterium]|nr:FtsW/RodA/SpoVE family cell cycle protein [Rubrobacteraceae bacterium]